MVKRTGVGADNLNLNSDYSTMGVGAIKKPLKRAVWWDEERMIRMRR
jgi:hypothetical protein